MAKDTQTINKEIGAIKAAGLKLDERIQACAMDVLEHLELHGDVTLLNRLYCALPRGARHTAFAAWTMSFAKVTANTDKATTKEMPFRYNKAGKNDLEGAAANPWYNFKPSPTVADMFDFKAQLASLLKKAGNAGVIVGASAEQIETLALMAGVAAPTGVEFAADKAAAQAIAKARQEAAAALETAGAE